MLPERRREGIGRALYDEAMRPPRAPTAARSVCGEVYVPAGSDGPGTPAYEFAAGLGFELVHREDHLMLGCPCPPRRSSAARAGAGRRGGVRRPHLAGPLPRRARRGVLRRCSTRMSNDVPIGEIDYEPVVVDVERLRAGEQRTSRSFDAITAVARRLDRR